VARRPSAAVRALARAVTWIFYRVERRGAPLPSGPALLVANHPNSLLDPAVVWATAGRDVRFLAKEPLFRMPVIGWIVRSAGAIPVYRARDAADMSKNTEMFAAVQAALAAGDAVCIFPEGTSHSTGRLEPLRTGAARIALGAAAAGVDVALVPVGLNFDRKSAFRSRAVIALGPAFFIAPDARRDGRDRSAGPDAEDVHGLTARIATEMRRLLVEADPRSDAAVIDRIDRLYRAARAEARAIDRLERRRLIAAGLDRLRAEAPEWYAEVADRVRTYDARLRRFGLRDRDLDGPAPAALVVRFALRESLAAVALAPLVLAGLIIFYVPYRLTDWVGRRAPDLDVQATTKVLGGIVVYGAWVAGLTALAGAAWGTRGAAVTLALLPPVALASLFAIEREAAVLAAVRGWLAVRWASVRARSRLRRQRIEIAEVLEQVRAWLAEAAEDAATN
jgi:1-acyl-sn-glycerol-3-phosphate acyltransferase